jgi:hypothetical protein
MIRGTILRLGFPSCSKPAFLPGRVPKQPSSLVVLPSLLPLVLFAHSSLDHGTIPLSLSAFRVARIRGDSCGADTPIQDHGVSLL